MSGIGTIVSCYSLCICRTYVAISSVCRPIELTKHSLFRDIMDLSIACGTDFSAALIGTVMFNRERHARGSIDFPVDQRGSAYGDGILTSNMQEAFARLQAVKMSQQG